MNIVSRGPQTTTLKPTPGRIRSPSRGFFWREILSSVCFIRKMRIGPIPLPALEILRVTLEEQSVPHKILFSEIAFEEAAARERARPPSRLPTYSGPIDMFYIELAEEHVGAAKELIEKIVGPTDPAELVELDETVEYHCPECDFTAEAPALCPTHRLPLLEFSDWAAAKAKKGDAVGKLFPWIFALLIAGLIGLRVAGWL